MRHITGTDSAVLYRAIARWLREPPDDRMPANAIAADLGLTVANLYQRVSRLKRARNGRAVALRAALEAVP